MNRYGHEKLEILCCHNQTVSPDSVDELFAIFLFETNDPLGRIFCDEKPFKIIVMIKMCLNNSDSITFKLTW
jgi:hypothetical protein